MISSLVLPKAMKRQSRVQKMINLSENQVHSDWKQIKSSSTVIARRSCHSSCIHNDNLYIYGGYDNNSSGIFDDMFVYSFKNQEWKCIQKKGDKPGPRHSHSFVAFNNEIYMFGGMVGLINNTKTLHKFNISSQQWKIVKTTNTPKAVDSHKACLYKNQMIVGFGYSQNEYNSNIYSLDLKTFEWKILYETKGHNSTQYPEERAFNSFNILNDSIYLYGGKNFDKVFNDFWKFDLVNNKFQKINIKNNLQERYGHSGIIFQEELFIFGGTKGVTYEKNDLLSICLKTGQIRTYWLDSQQQIINRNNNQLRQTNTRSRRNSSFKKTQSLKKQNNQNNNSHVSPNKYRTQLKQVNYYNQLYNSRQIEELTNKKIRKNPLLTELEKTTQEQNQTFNLNATFEILTNSLLFIGNKSPIKPEKIQKSQQAIRKIPKARDNFTADLLMADNAYLIIFGGGMHKISFNDLICIDLKQIKITLDNITR